MQLERTSSDGVEAGIGLGYIIILIAKKLANPLYICCLCREQMNHIKEHLKSNRHCTKYLVSLQRTPFDHFHSK